MCWACAITDTPWVFLAETRTNFFDVGGVKRWWRGVFEGDDSFARVVPALKTMPSTSSSVLDGTVTGTT